MAPPLKAGVLCNPLSGRARRSLGPLRRAAAALPDARYREAASRLEMVAALDEFLEQSVDVLAVIGGDGTVHAALSHLFGSGTPGILPMLTVIPAGTTNMTASDLGIGGNPAALLRRLRDRLEHPEQARIETRSVLRVEHGEMLLHGMFFGTGIIAEGVRFFLEHVRKTGITGERGSALVMARSLAKVFWSGTQANRMLLNAALSLESEMCREQNYLLVFATTLQRLLLGMRPYWGREPAPIHATALAAAPLRLWRSVPCLISGRGSGLRVEDGYLSRNVSRMALQMGGEFALDGQLYGADPGQGPVRVCAAGPIRVMQI
ncbi:MAG: hypothetical protein HYY48_09360 [Gammaproteobacteria bacterium]|nr:hypothetical protein [Gammaproteobacteria bacterium]